MSKSNDNLYSITVKGGSLDDLKNNLAGILAELMNDGETDADAEVDAKAVKKAVAGTGKVSAPKGKKAKQPEPEPEEDEDADESGEESGDDADEDESGEDADEEITFDDLKDLLLEVKSAFPDDANVTTKLCQKFGGPMLKNVKPAKYPDLKAAIDAKLATAKKGGKKK